MTYRQKETFRIMHFDEETRRKAWQSVPREERALLVRALRAACDGRRGTAVDALDWYTVARYRRGRKAQADAVRDARRRVLVGARLDRETADRVRAAADARGVSVYRFVREAVERELFRFESLYGIIGCVDKSQGGEARTNVPETGD